MDLPAKMSQQEWEGRFFGQVRMVGSKCAPQLLMPDQKLRRIVEYRNKKYMVTAWTPPDGSAYVEAEPIHEGTRSKNDPTGRIDEVIIEKSIETLKKAIDRTAPREMVQGDDLGGPHDPCPSRELIYEGRMERSDRDDRDSNEEGSSTGTEE